MAWVAPVVAAGATVLSSVINSNSSGKGSSSSVPAYTMQMMPADLQAKFTSSMQAMPSTANVSFGGSMYPTTYGPLLRTAKALYAPQGQNATGASVSPLTGAMTAAAPWAWMAANNQTNQQVQQGAPSAASAYGNGYYSPSGYYPADYLFGQQYYGE